MNRLWAITVLTAFLIQGRTDARSVYNTWQRSTLDQAGDTGMHTSLAFSPSGAMAISYYDADNGNLKCIRSFAGIYITQTVDSTGDVGAFSSLAYAPDGTPAIAYYDATNGNLKYADIVAGVWTPRTVYSTGNAGYQPSLAFTPDGRPAISFYDASNGRLLYAEFEATSWLVWDVGVVDDTADVGYFSSLAFNASGRPAVSYYDIAAKDLKYAVHNGTTWARMRLDSTGDVGYHTSLAFSPAGVAYIAYYDNTNMDLKMVSVGSGGLISPQAIDAGGAVGTYPSIAFTPGGQPAISYHDYTRGDLKYAVFNGLLWVLRTVDAGGGIYPSLAFTADGLPAISYYDDQSLKYARAVDTRPPSTDFDGDGISDIGVYYPTKGKWHFKNSGGWTIENQFGYKGTLPVTGDFDGDGFTDYGCYDPVGIPGLAAPGSWYLQQSRNGFRTATFGYKGTLPVTGDFDGDGIDDFGCYDPAGIPGLALPGSWYLQLSKKGFQTASFGYKGTLPVVGDFDGDGIDDFGCYDPVGIPGIAPPGSWYLQQSKKGFRTATFGYKGTRAVAGDYDGDDTDDFGCYDTTGIPGLASPGSWYLQQSRDGFRTATFGYAGTLPLGNLPPW